MSTTSTMKTLIAKHKTFFQMLVAAILGGAIVMGLFAAFGPMGNPSISELQAESTNAQVRFTRNASGEPLPDFREASAHARPAVVHIKSKMSNTSGRDRNPLRDLFRDDFNMPRGIPRQASGSGVILTPNGYIVTNNHVVQDAATIEVTTYDNHSYEATVIGTDPASDLALLKIEPEKDLPILTFGNSEQLEVGEWVLAVGNPFNLTSTVTAGIVSAKARAIGILSDDYAIESFIQTDAAVNPGNSGGALINQSGDLVGINTAIASKTGGYMGYSFAIPAQLVEKVTNDLKTYGEVQRAVLGIRISDVNAQLVERDNLDITQGAYILSVNEGSAADEAGLQQGDVVISVDGERVKNSSELQQRISLKRPGDEVTVAFYRGGKRKEQTVELKSRSGTSEVATKNVQPTLKKLGAELAQAADEDLENLRLEHGVKVVGLTAGKLRSAGVAEGFIITHIDKQAVKTPEDVAQKLENAKDGVMIAGYYPDGSKAYYAFGF